MAERRADTELDRKLSELANDFAAGLGALASGEPLRTAIARAGVAEVILALEAEFSDSKDVIADELSTQLSVIQDEMRASARSIASL